MFTTANLLAVWLVRRQCDPVGPDQCSRCATHPIPNVAPEPVVRTWLTAGGSRIRTVGPRLRWARAHLGTRHRAKPGMA